jgi:hypothetical protein
MYGGCSCSHFAVQLHTQHVRSGVVCCTNSDSETCRLSDGLSRSHIVRIAIHRYEVDIAVSVLLALLSPYAAANTKNCSTYCCRHFSYPFYIPLNKIQLSCGMSARLPCRVSFFLPSIFVYFSFCLSFFIQSNFDIKSVPLFFYF